MPRPPETDCRTTAEASYGVEIIPVKAGVSGVCAAPGSKSLTVRALLLAGFAHGTSHLTGLLDSDDAYWARDVLGRLGVEIETLAADSCGYMVRGCGGSPPVTQTHLHLGDAGTLARFLPGLLAAAPTGLWTLAASPQLTRRPLKPLIDALHDIGAGVQAADQNGLPLRITGRGLREGAVNLAGDVSSQFVSGILIAAAASGKPLQVRLDGRLVQPAYVEMTVRYLQIFGAQILFEKAHGVWHVMPSRLVAQRLHVEADASTACYFWALAAATQGQITVRNVGNASMQGGCGPTVLATADGLSAHPTTHATTVVGPKQLRGGFEADLRLISDQAPTLAALAALADAPINIIGVGHIRYHESNRLVAMAQALQAVGVQVQVHETGMRVVPQRRHGAEIDPHGDHRIAMSMALIGANTSGVRINGAECVSKTCPQYFQMLEALGLTIRRWTIEDV